MCKKQFDLAYYANISPAITDEMATYELDLYYSFLEDVKNAEREVAEQRIKALQGK